MALTLGQLGPITLEFKTAVTGYWDGGKRAGGVFTPTIAWSTDATRSFVKWGCFELNFWFNLPLHTKAGRELENWEVMARARKYLRKICRVPVKLT